MKISRRQFIRLSSIALPGVASMSACQDQGGSGDSGDNTPGATSEPPATPQPTPNPAPQATALLSARRDFGEDWQTFWGCDTAGTGKRLGVLIDNAMFFEGDILAAANDFTGLVTATNLLPGRHTYQMTLDGVPVGIARDFSTAPAPGDDFDMLFIGDAHQDVDAAFGRLISRERQAAFVFSTEVYYLDDQFIYGGRLYKDGNDLAQSAAWPGSYQNRLGGFNGQPGFRSKYRQALIEEPLRHEAQNVWPIFNMPHNHDMAASDPPAAPGTVRYDAAHKALFEYPSNGNPVASTGPVDDEPNPVLYFNKVIGDVEFIAPDMLTYSSPFAAGEMLGSNGNGAGSDRQIQWLKDTVRASTARFIVLLMQKPALGSEWYDPVSGIIPFLSSIDKTVVAFTANTHNQHAQLIKTQVPFRPLLEVGASSFSGVTSSSGFFIPEVNTVYFSNSHNETALLSDYDGSNTLLVESTSGMRQTRKLGIRLDSGGTETVFITQVVSPNEVVINRPLGGAASAGNLVTYFDWSDTNDIATAPESTFCCYGKLLVRTSGTAEAPYPHIELQIKQTFSDRIIWRAIVREGRRIPSIVEFP